MKKKTRTTDFAVALIHAYVANVSCFISFIGLIIKLTVDYRSHALAFMFIKAKRPEEPK